MFSKLEQIIAKVQKMRRLTLKKNSAASAHQVGGQTVKCSWGKEGGGSQPPSLPDQGQLIAYQQQVKITLN